jgi:hypothetical protein
VEGLADGIVIAIADASHRDLDPGLGAPFGEQHRGELAALVGVMNEAGVGATSGERHLERVDDELGAQMVGHRPADDPPREQVLDVRARYRNPSHVEI